MRLVPVAFALISCADTVAVGLPYLEADGTVALGAVTVGAPITARAEVHNIGTADARAAVRAGPGIDAPDTLQVPAGGSATLAVVFELVDPTASAFPVTVVAGDSSVTITFTASGVTDADGDGFMAATLGGDDCDDADAAVHPGVTERCDGVDQDCDGFVDDLAAPLIWFTDADGDGHGDPDQAFPAGCDGLPGTVTDGADCNDSAPTVHPGAQELDDTVDQDCDGAPDEDFAELGDALITEVHLDPSDPDATYVELLAIGSRGLEPGLLTANGAPIASGFTIAPGEHGLICGTSAPTGLPCAGFVALAVDGIWTLAGSSGGLDSVDLTQIGGQPGVARELDPGVTDPAANDGPVGWCDASIPAGSGDLGTPGAPNQVEPGTCATADP